LRKSPDVEPAGVDTGVHFRMEIVDLVSIPLFIYKSVDEFGKAMHTSCRRRSSRRTKRPRL
jgi:hypothetical protein